MISGWTLKKHTLKRLTCPSYFVTTPNQYELSILGAMRAQQLLNGARPLVKTDNREIVVALREIAAGKVGKASKKT